jgi:hypothetical protein
MSGLPDEAVPRKAYYVEEVFRGVKTTLVYAHTAEDAKRRRFTEGISIDSEAHPAGVRRVRRAPEEDRDA